MAMSDELKDRVLGIVQSHIGLNGTAYIGILKVEDMLAQIDQAYKEEQHTNALIWYTRLTNDLINDDELKRTEHVGRILEYARTAAALSKEEVKITLPDKLTLH